MVSRTRSLRRKPSQRGSSTEEACPRPPPPARRTSSGQKSQNNGKLHRSTNSAGSFRSILRTPSSDSMESRWSRRSSDDSIIEDESDALLRPQAVRIKGPRKQSFRINGGASFRSTSSGNSFRQNDGDQIVSAASHKMLLLGASLTVALCCVGSLVIQSYFLWGLKSAKTKVSVQTSEMASSPSVSLDVSTMGHQKETDGERNSAYRPDNTEYEPESVVDSNDQRSFSQLEIFEKNRDLLENYLSENGAETIRRTVSAFTENPLNDTVPGTGSRDNPDDVNFGTAPDFVTPLPLRTQAPDMLEMHLYPSLRTCHDVPALFPVDRGIVRDESGKPVIWNTGNEPVPPSFPTEEAAFCPVELDPFLPWIHDVFSARDGSYVEFIAQNRRRCRTGKKQTESVNRLVPQVALLQGVSVKRIEETEAQRLAPDLWNSGSNTTGSPRYRLANEDDADTDGQQTRFICRFKGVEMNEAGGSPKTTVIGETLSFFPFSYEFVSYRKGMRSLLTPRGNDAGFFWTSTLRFRCPVPESIQSVVKNGVTMLSDGTATVHMDIVPIRTSVRYDEVYLSKGTIKPDARLKLFDPETRWGTANVLPRVEASGRWENIPVCPPPKPGGLETTKLRDLVQEEKEKKTKKHYLSACLWASAEFKARGEKKATNNDTVNRMVEWIEFHLMVGFEHIYVYDNTKAHTNESSLEPVLSLFGDAVTRIDWPHVICNNNKPAADSAGERSSQYAAEASCLARYGPHSEWLASFDTDEYLVPMGNYTNMQDVLRDVHNKGTNILSLRSSRGKLRRDMTEPKSNSLVKKPETLFLEAYNCDSTGSPKPEWADRARKQIYRSAYVIHHFVHYSTVTKGIVKTYSEAQQANEKWLKRTTEHEPSQVTSDELSQAVMVHTKSVSVEATSKWAQQCRFDEKKKWKGCFVGFPWPDGIVSTNATYNSEGYDYNCFINPSVEQIWIPKLRAALSARKISDRLAN